MKWFKHDSNARHDAKLAKLRLKYGLEGYGLYFFLLECIAGTVEAHNLTFELEEDSELISAMTNIHYERVSEMVTYMVDLNLFQCVHGVITCPKMRERTDEYTAKLIRNVKSVRTNSGVAPDKVPPNRIEKKRTDKNKQIFKPPTVSEVEDYCRERGNGVDASRFVDYYEAAGWMRGKNKIKDWKACVRTWERNSKDANEGFVL